MNWDWATVGYWTLGLSGALLGCAAIDCLFDGLRDWRRSERVFDREIGLLTAATGLGLLLLATLLLWASYALR